MESLLAELIKGVPAGQAVGLILMAMLLKYVHEIVKEFRQLSVSMRELNIWMKEHEKLDNERFRALEVNHSAGER